MELKLYDGGWKGPAVTGSGVTHYLWFTVEGAPGKFLVVQLDDEVLWRLAPGPARQDPKAQTERVVDLVLTRLMALGVDRLDGLLLADQRYPTYSVHLADSDVPALQSALVQKRCGYQALRGSDMFCAATVAVAGLGSVSFEGATTRHQCAECTMPDTRIACSYLHHAKVAMAASGPPQLVAARCDLGKPEGTQRPTACRPGGHGCWTREVEFEERPLLPHSPLALLEAFDHFDAVWRSSFRLHILRLRASAVAGKLATPCTSHSDFEVKLSALADVFNSLEVNDDLLKPEHRESLNHQKGMTLARVESAIVRRLEGGGGDPTDSERARVAVGILRNAMHLRRGFQHTGDASSKLPAALSRFGLPYPPGPAEESWTRVQGAVLEALGDLRDLLRDLE